MNKYMFTMVMMLVLTLSLESIQAQDNVQYAVQGEKIKYVKYYDNGQVMEKGFYDLDKKLTGRWVQYNEDGKKLAIAHYESGKKVGKWFFWKEDLLFEIDYKDHQLAQIKSWSNSKIVSRD